MKSGSAYYMDLSGIQVDSLVCLGDSGKHDRIICKCVECNEVQLRSKKTFKALWQGRNASNGAKHITCSNKACKFHSYRTDLIKVGDLYGDYVIEEKLSKYRVLIRCKKCNDTRYIQIASLNNKSSCRNEDCSSYVKPDSSSFVKIKPKGRNLKYKEGNIYNDLEFISFDNGLYIVKCILCGEEFKVQSYCFNDNKPHCRNISCTNYCVRSLSEYKGQVHRNLECLDVIRINGKLGVHLKCNFCGTEFSTVYTSHFKGNRVRCINTECKNHSNSNEEMGRVFGKVMVLSQMNRIRFNVECTLCKTQFSAIKRDTKLGRVTCVNKDCENFYVDYNRCVGNIYGDYKILERLGYSTYRCQCTVCGDVVVLDEKPNPKKRCKNHPRRRPRCVSIFKDFSIDSYAYNYRGEDFFICTDLISNKVDILSVRQMVEARRDDT